jgi:hypothetical protein
MDSGRVHYKWTLDDIMMEYGGTILVSFRQPRFFTTQRTLIYPRLLMPLRKYLSCAPYLLIWCTKMYGCLPWDPTSNARHLINQLCCKILQ